MMSSEAVLKRVCAKGGSVPYEDLISDFRSGTFDGWFNTVFVDRILEGTESLVTVLVNEQKTVIARAAVKLCREQNCGCTNLHVCKFFLLGDCQYGRGRRGCRFSHDLQAEQNAAVLQKHSLSQLDRRELCILLLQSDHSLLPEVCHSYNNGAGPYGRCAQADNCKRMHICEKYLRGPCQCPRAHDFYEPHPLKTLQGRGVPNDLMPSMKSVYSNIECLRINDKVTSAQNGVNAKARPGRKGNIHKQASGGANAKSANRNKRSSAPRNQTNSQEKSEICMYFIKGHCRNGDRCFKEHSKLPYKWEVKVGLGWDALPNNEGIEKDYCDPAKTYSAGVSFDTMTREGEAVRRLSTLSCAVQPTYILTTRWLWYWEDEHGQWVQYASAGSGHSAASITSEDLEQKYTQDNKADVEFTAGSQTYTLSFQDMIQTNRRYGTKKLVSRRPEFVSADEAQRIRTTKPNGGNHMGALPSHWNKALTPETGYKTLQLQTDSGEYVAAERLFRSTMHAFSVQKIERIQNRELWEVFQWQKNRMMKNNGGSVAEKQLFHGTDPKHVEAISRHNLDWRICGTHGTAYGRGSYFARDAKYSHSYTGDSSPRCMFLCRVLVGDYTLGKSDYTRAPSRDGGDTFFFDSCVNNVDNPSIFVVFEKHQIYPEYLITYNDTSSSYYIQPYQPTSTPRVHPATSAYKPAPALSIPPYTPPAAPSTAAYKPTAAPSTTAYKPTATTSTTAYKPTAAPSTMAHKPTATTSTTAYKPTAAPSTMAHKPTATTTTAAYKPAAALSAAAYKPAPALSTAAYKPAPALSTAAYKPTASPSTTAYKPTAPSTPAYPSRPATPSYSPNYSSSYSSNSYSAPSTTRQSKSDKPCVIC